MSRRENGTPPQVVVTAACPRWVRRSLVGLMLLSVLLTVGLAVGAVYVYQANQYVQGRGEYRDREATRIQEEAQERIRQAICDLLDQLPEGGLLDRPRAKYGCGPGIPHDQLTDDERARIRVPSPATPAESSPAPRSSPPTRGPQRASGAETFRPPPGQEPAPTSAPAPPPPVDLGPVTAPVCGATGVCLP